MAEGNPPTSAPALLDPQTVTLAQVAALVDQARIAREACEDIDTAREIKRRLEAVHKYIADKQARAAMERELRLTEVLIGRLLGAPRQGARTDLTSIPRKEVDELNDRHKTEFRVLADHVTQVEELLDQGVTKRAQILKRIEQRERMQEPAPVSASGTFGVIYADPPWRYNHAATPNRAIENHYPTMADDELCRLSVPADDDAALFLWATAPKLREALAVVEAWGFEYVTNAVWVKPQLGMGYWFRGRHELLLVGKRGAISPPNEEARAPSVIDAPRTQHSAKPPEVYGLIERMYPHLPRVELFARCERDGWASWGNEVQAA